MNDENLHPSYNGSINDQSSRFNSESAANEVRSMHTRLAELLDSVTLVAEGERASTDKKPTAPEPMSPEVNAPVISPFSKFEPEPTEPVADSLFSFMNTQAEPEMIPPHIAMADSEGVDTKMTNFDLQDGNDSANSAISIKGRADGISIEIGVGSWRMLMSQLRTRLHQASGFFRGGTVTLGIGDRSITVEELSLVSEALDEHGMQLKLVRSTSEQSCQAAATLGIATQLEKSEGAIAQTALTNHEELSHFVYRGNLRSGQVLRRAETILVLGDVNPGAQVVSEGDVLVWGRLRGSVHAGSTGDQDAIISALSMEPTQIRIGESVAIMPESQERRRLFGARKRRPDLTPRPEVAHLDGNQIVVEPWDESKPGGIMAFRR